MPKQGKYDWKYGDRYRECKVKKETEINSKRNKIFFKKIENTGIGDPTYIQLELKDLKTKQW